MKILGMRSAKQAAENAAGGNMTISGPMVIEMLDAISSLEAELKRMEDYVTHHNDWASACEIAVLNADNANDASYWEHQLLTLAKLSPPQEQDK